MSEAMISVSVPKELNDVLVAIENLVVSVKAGTPLATLAAQELPVIISLVGELGAIPGDITADVGGTIDAALLFARKIAFTLLGK